MTMQQPPMATLPPSFCLAVPRRSPWLVLVAALVFGGCSVTQPHRAPVEERSAANAEPPVARGAAPEVKEVAAEAARPNSYTVRAGDTLIRIALEQGIGWRDLARWNGLDNPNLIEKGQVLRLAPPDAPDGLATRAVANARVESKPLESKPQDPAKAASAPVAAPTPTPTPVPTPPSAPAPDAELAWAWPAQGAFLSGFDEQRGQKGVLIGGKAGDPVFAAADGRVMYAGSGLRGYGNMVIIKHNDTYLSAYAHNQALLVKEDQVVRRGQLIAEMGSSDTDQVKLHFEIRRKGKLTDPARLLPPR